MFNNLKKKHEEKVLREYEDTKRRAIEAIGDGLIPAGEDEYELFLQLKKEGKGPVRVNHLGRAIQEIAKERTEERMRGFKEGGSSGESQE